jgi:hypothetical protein
VLPTAARRTKANEEREMIMVFEEEEREPLPVNPSAAVKLTIENYDLGSVEERVVALVLQKVEARIGRASEKALTETIQERISAAVDAAVEARICAELEKAIAEGWPRTNSYGEVVGKAITLKERISEYLHGKRDNYSSRGNRLEEAVSEAVAKALREGFDKELDAAKKKFRAMFDDAVMGSWLKTVKQSLGVKD